MKFWRRREPSRIAAMRARDILAVALIACAGAAPAQESTLIDADASRGAFGGPVLKLTRFSHRDAFMFGGRGGLIIGGTWVIGGSGFGWSNSAVPGRDGSTHTLDIGYGGVDFEYVHRSRNLVHLAAQLTIGGGGVTQDGNTGRAKRDDAFFVVEPGITSEVNVTRGFHLAGGVTYRWITGVQMPAFRDEDLRGFSAILAFKFGKFRSG